MSSSQEHYQQKQRLFATESTAIIVVNLVLAIAATTALVRLVSYNIAQQKTVEILDAEVEETQDRVGKVREEFSQYFDPQQTKAIMRQRSHRVEAGQAHIILIEPEQLTVEDTVSTTDGQPQMERSAPTNSTTDAISSPEARNSTVGAESGITRSSDERESSTAPLESASPENLSSGSTELDEERLGNRRSPLQNSMFSSSQRSQPQRHWLVDEQ